jgi:hypothetical protein
MDITTIEQKSFAELKAERSELTLQAKGAPLDALASHYIRALTDAKHRDEKMGEQGRTITALQDALDAEKAKVTELAASLKEASETLEQVRASAQGVARSDKLAIGTLTEGVAQQTARADRLKVHADISKEAVVQAAATLNAAVAKMQTEAADQGE